LFATLAGGMQRLIDALEGKIAQSAQLTKSQRVSGVRRTEAGFELSLPGPQPRAADGVLLTLPTYLNADLLAADQPDLATALNSIEYASSAIMVSGHKLADIEHPCDAFGLVIPHRERRRILAVSFLSRKFPGRAPEGHIVLRTFVGGAMQPEEFDHSDEEVQALVLRELGELLGVRGTPDFVRIARYARGMPQYTLGHPDRVREVERLTAAVGGLEIAGNAYHGVGVPDSVRSGEAAAERLWESVFPASEKGEGVA
ncbi:MAG: protoporphyrinogen oxidase, partial [Planctomycetaceae bacterium]|nr:protoporphyrinogen oxidase [Planctomycetaceae bacterium]